MPSAPFISRRRFTASLLLAALASARGAEAEGRKLDLLIDAKSFSSSEADIRAVLLSAAGEIWRHCATARFEFGFRIYRNEKFPITHYEHEDGRIVIGLATEKTFWAQYAYQFAHEFGHALMDHANDWRRFWHHGEHANQWVEETFCEVASLFALRAMGRTWSTSAPYPNWRSFAKSLTSYAQARMDDPRHQLPAGKSLADWWTEAAPIQRTKWTRENNTMMALRLLPLFEAEPAGWDALTSINLCTHEPQKPLARFLEEWKTNAPASQQAFIEKVIQAFP